ncbi:tRNA (N6-isopentenyl adenosine(37)-C2)-methylthiotransferase MiaB [Patescibacteria group bacterium]|nr:tRNA (N6-isopentenyl adenosine(37)-C2)-methylthiotransferase MiaB [Patescibacteria group bacterium]
MNKSDSERVAQVLERIGYKKASKINGADLIMVNMCSVRQSAVDRVFGLQSKFEKLKTKNKKLKTILTGCILKKDRKKFAKYFDYILNIRDLPKWPKLLKIKNYELRIKNYLEIEPKYSSFPVGYVPISAGCTNFCSYCVVPYTRGSEICRPAEEILSEIKQLVKDGYKEIWLLGQNVNSYIFQNINFPRLLTMVNDIPGDFWIRFTSSHPKDFSDELIGAMAECEKVTPYLNLPVQSGDNEILRKMNRNYKIEDYKKLVKKIRKKIPEITLSTDVIVGFPEETEKQFENTVKLFKEIKYDMAYIAQYSPRPGTAAIKMIDNIPKEEKKQRERTLTEILKETALIKNKKYIDKTIKVLPNEYKNSFLIGKSFHYKTLKFKGNKNLIGKFVKVKVIDATPWGLSGKSIKEKCL